MTDKEINKLSQLIWNYHHMDQKLEKADFVIVLGSHDLRVAEYGAQLFLNNYAPLLILSGGLGRLTQGTWEKPEAEIFAKIALEMGVPKDKILIENKSTNTGENLLFTYELLKEKNLHFNKLILVQKPYMERRTYATFKKQWPDPTTEIFVTSPQLSFSDYCTNEYPKDKVIAIILGDLKRIKTYPEKGFQIYQEIPKDVWNAYEKLIPYIEDSPYSNYLNS